MPALGTFLKRKISKLNCAGAFASSSVARVKPYFHRATILGVGLLGGSLGKALRGRGLAKRICAWSPSPSTRMACSREKWCDQAFDTATAACKGADLVVLCGPVDRIAPLLEEIAPFCPEGCLVTDVGSTKRAICEEGDRIFGDCHTASFVGSHPMAGSEKSGLQHAHGDLFAGMPCFVTKGSNSLETAVTRAIDFWENLGMNVLTCSPEEHDRIVARISHLPHAIAAILSVSLSNGGIDERRSSGAGLRDTTRVAAGDPGLWRAILTQNRTALEESLDEFEATFEKFRAALRSGPGELEKFLREAREFRALLDSEDPSR